MRKTLRRTRKVFIKNYSGNIGKSKWAVSIFSSRSPEQLSEVEAINDCENTDRKMSTRRLDRLRDAMGAVANTVVDINASNDE